MTETSRGTGKWAQAGVPHRGWTCIGIEDLGEPSAICEMCETQEIRFVHYMTHPDCTAEIAAGCICAGRMEENYEGARNREAILRSAAGKKRRWLDRKWKVSRAGNPYINANGYNVVVFPTGTPTTPSWGFRVTNQETESYVTSRKLLPTEDAAKLRAFDAIVWMQNRGR